jgi:hypothetical protein
VAKENVEKMDGKLKMSMTYIILGLQHLPGKRNEKVCFSLWKKLGRKRPFRISILYFVNLLNDCLFWWIFKCNWLAFSYPGKLQAIYFMLRSCELTRLICGTTPWVRPDHVMAYMIFASLQVCPGWSKYPCCQDCIFVGKTGECTL